MYIILMSFLSQENETQVDIRYFTMPPPYPSARLLRFFLFKNRFILTQYVEHVVHNDCFYRNMYKYKYVGIFDMDEVIIMREEASLPRQVQRDAWGQEERKRMDSLMWTIACTSFKSFLAD